MPTTTDDIFQRTGGPKVWNRRYHCWSYSRHDHQRFASVRASPRLKMGIIWRLGCGNSGGFSWAVPTTTGDDIFQKTGGPKVWNWRYHCYWSFSRHDQRETLRLHSRRSRGGEAGRARRRSWVLSSCMPREPPSAEGRAASVQSEARARGRQSARSAWVVKARETLSLPKTTPRRRG